MIGNKRFTIKPQDDYFGITDNNTADKMNVINGIHTEIEAEWLCDLMNELNEEKEDWKNNCLNTVSENSILWNEIFILREQGAEPSDAFKTYLNALKIKIKKLQEDVE